MTDTLYFVCNWGENPVAWLSYKPYKEGFEVGQVRWRGRPFIVKLISCTPVCVSKYVVEKYDNTLYSLLKSNLQKQIRRGKISAIATASRLWELGKFELLRRLIVISAEDAEMSQESAVVTWLMAAVTKGLELNADHREWVLGYIRALVHVPTCTWLSLCRADSQDIAPIDILDVSLDKNEILAAIYFRTAYGGMKCDEAMLTGIIQLYCRLDIPLVSLSVKRWKEPLPTLLINRAAIDYHIWPGLIDKLAHKSGLDPDIIGKTIWECSSRINIRFHQSSDLEDQWTILRPLFKELTMRYMARILTKHPQM